jgi:tRNA C32,U32 (ribose-2'-O)-methylase TrmJ
MSGSILVLHNIAKKKNFGELIRTAAAMGVEEVVIVGAAKLATHGAHGCSSHVRFSHFLNFRTACAYLRDVRKATLCGVEITPESQPVQQHPFRGTTAFLMGNEGQGLTEAQMDACDHFVYIPQHSDATASLNVNAASAVVLHHFAMWASLPEAPREGFKFTVGAPQQSVAHSGVGIKQMRTLNADGTVLSRGERADAGADAAADGAADYAEGEEGEEAVDLFAEEPEGGAAAEGDAAEGRDAVKRGDGASGT